MQRGRRGRLHPDTLTSFGFVLYTKYILIPIFIDCCTNVDDVVTKKKLSFTVTDCALCFKDANLK